MRILEERKDKLKKFKEEEIYNKEKDKKSEGLQKILDKIKKEKEIEKKCNNDYVKLILCLIAFRPPWNLNPSPN